MFDPHQSVASVVLAHTECAVIFSRHRIDSCCRGNLSLAVAAGEKGLDVGTLVQELEGAVAARGPGAPFDARTLSTPDLLELIVSRHHAYLRQAVPFVQMLATKVSRVHGEHNPKLRGLEEAVLELAELLVPHLVEEEQVLFPALLALTMPPVEVRRLLTEMQGEHLVVGAVLDRIHDAADGFTLPEWACTSYRTLFGELEHLDRDLRAHVLLENHVLVPRFAAPLG